MSQKTVLLAEDDASIRLIVNQTLVTAGYTVRATSSPEALERWVRNGEGDIVVTDVYLTDTPIFELLPSFKLVRPELPIIVMSGQNTILTAASAAQHGAYDYLPKPFDLPDLMKRTARALENRNKTPKREEPVVGADEPDELPLVGKTPAMQGLYRLVARVMNTDLPVLILGESGTGKEVVSQALHFRGPRAQSPFVAVNCAALTETLLESELFGHEKGAFTDAHDSRQGKFELAEGGLHELF